MSFGIGWLNGEIWYILWGQKTDFNPKKNAILGVHSNAPIDYSYFWAFIIAINA